MYKTPRIIKATTPSPSRQTITNEFSESIMKNFFNNPILKDNVNQIFRVLFQSLIQELYPYILTTLAFMLISFILLISIFILLLWRERNG